MPNLASRLGSAFRSAVREIRGLPPPGSVLTGSFGVPATFKPQESLQAYGDNPFLYSAVNAVAHEVARTPLKLVTRNRDGETEFVQSHVALDTLEKPKPTSGGKSTLTKMQLKMVTAMHLMLNGEAIWALDRRLKLTKAPTMIDPMIPGDVRVKINPDSGDLTGYVYTLPNRQVELPPEDVVHFKLVSPLDWTRGHSPVQSIRYALDAHQEADKLNFARLRNGAIPAGALKTEQKVDDEQRRKFLTQWNQMYGGGHNSGKTAFLPQGISYETVAQTNQEMQYIEGKAVNMKEILANYRVGPEMLGMTESQTRANAEAAIFAFMRFGILPFLELFADTLTNDYLPAFPGTEGMFFTFDDPVPENLEEKRLNAQTLFANGGLTPNEMRQMFGLEPINLPEMDVPYLGLGSVPMGQDDPEPEDPPLG